MSDFQETEWDPLSTVVVDSRVAKAFEAAVENGGEPDLAALAGQFAPELRAETTVQLIALDTAWRKARGQPEQVVAAYAAMFPEHAHAICSAVSRAAGAADSCALTEDPFQTRDGERTGDIPPVKELSSSLRSALDRDYELLEEIGRGGMGIVYKARQRGVDRIVALKLIKNAAYAAQERERFLRGAQAACKLDHPHIVPVYDFGEYDGEPYLTMSFVEGGSLKGVLQNGLPDPAEVTLWMADVADAIAHAHDRGVIHRDLKPDNILLGTDGRVRVTDFGLARMADGDRDLTGEGQLLGTAGYMAPEQARGRKLEIGPHTDVYGLGATMYAMLTGHPPFRASRLLDTLNLIVDEKPVPPRQLNRSVSKELESVCLKCLEKSPTSRYTGAHALADELRALARCSTVEATPPTAKNIAKVPLVAVAVGGIALGGWWIRNEWFSHHGDGKSSANASTANPNEPPKSGSAGKPVSEAANAPSTTPPPIAQPEAIAVADSNPILPAKVTAFRIERYRDTLDQSRLLGEIGGDLQHANVDDAVRVSVDFDQQAYALLLALNPDGTSQLCWPSDPKSIPRPVKSIRYPADPQSAFYLTDGAGQQAFAVVVSRKPIPAFEKWPSRFGWAKAHPQSFLQAAATAQANETVRGTEKRLKGAVALEELCQNLRTVTDADRVEAIAFPVHPKQ